MNLIEIYLEENYSVKSTFLIWAKSINNKFVEVKARWISMGMENDNIRVYNIETWEEFKQKGYC